VCRLDMILSRQVGVLAICGGALLVALSAQAVRMFISRDVGFSIKRSLSADLGRWRYSDLPVGASEFESRMAQAVLQFDECVHRRYYRQGGEFTFFVATYAPDTVAVSDVRQHTPDQCWPAVGWRSIAKESGVTLRVAGRRLPPGEWRAFRGGSGEEVEVIFWHTIGGRSLAKYDRGLGSGLREAIRQFGEPNRRQFFVRIASRQSLAELLDDVDLEGHFSELFELSLRWE